MKAWTNLVSTLLLVLVSILIPEAVLAGDSGYSSGGSWSDSAKSTTMASMSKGYIKILAPTDGKVLKSERGDKLKYDVQLSPDGNHLHVYVDNDKPIIDRKVKGCPCAITLPRLSPGKHTIAVKEATKHHHLTGLMSSVTFDVK